MKHTPLIVDTAIIGGGITGLYTCLELRKQKGPQHTMAVFEATGRFGGRIETVDMDGFLAEYGPMRFEQQQQPLLMQLIDELALETNYFPPYLPAIDPETLFNLREEEGLPNPEGKLLDALELLKLGILRILQQSHGDMNDPEDPHHMEWWAGVDEAFCHQVRTQVTLQGQPLAQIGFWDALNAVLPHRAVETIIRYGTFYHEIHLNPNAAEWVIFWLRGLHPNDELVGIKQGSESLITNLIEHLSQLQPEPAPLYSEHRLLRFQEQGERIRLEIATNTGEILEVFAKHLVLALPQSPLEKLSPWFPEPIQQHVQSVVPIPLVKCFFVTKNPWWDENTRPQTRAASIPTREIHYSFRQQGEDKLGMVMIYGDDPSSNYWKPFVRNEPHITAELNEDRQLLDRYMKYLRRNPASEDTEEYKKELENITSFGIHDWGREPYKGGCHIWKPGIDVEQVIDELSAFSLSGTGSRNVHICGEAYSDFQGFIEGGLRNALKVIEKIE
jgi:hypothetical protein